MTRRPTARSTPPFALARSSALAWSRGLVRACALFGALALGGCDDKPRTAAPATSASVATPKASSGASAAPAPTKPAGPWFAGQWKGTYDAQHYLIETPKNEGAREWRTDDGGAHAGEGELSVSVSETGDISGWARGPLGEQLLSGDVEGETFHLQLSPKTPGERAFSGIALLKRKGDVLSGRLQSSSGDSRTVRDAPVELRRPGSQAEGGAAPAPSASN